MSIAIAIYKTPDNRDVRAQVLSIGYRPPNGDVLAFLRNGIASVFLSLDSRVQINSIVWLLAIKTRTLTHDLRCTGESHSLFKDAIQYGSVLVS